VSLACARLPVVLTWTVDLAQSRLADAKEAFEGYVELLTQGNTSKLWAVPEAGLGVRGTGLVAGAPVAPVPSRPSRAWRGAEPPAVQRDLFANGAAPGAPEAPAAVGPGARLRGWVVDVKRQ